MPLPTSAAYSGHPDGSRMPSLSFPSAFGGVYKRDPFGPNRGVNGKAVHQPFKFLCSNASGFLCGSWPLEASLRQPDIQKDESVPGPEQSLDPVASGAAEQE